MSYRPSKRHPWHDCMPLADRIARSEQQASARVAFDRITHILREVRLEAARKRRPLRSARAMAGRV